MKTFRQVCFLYLFLAPFALFAEIQVSINGPEPNLQEQILRAISLVRQKDNKRLTPASVNALYQRADDEIRTLLRAKGYYHPTIEKSLESRGDTWLCNFEVVPGPPVTVHRMTLMIEGEAEKDETLTAAMNNFPLQPGVQLDHGEYETGKKNIQNLASNRGYFDAHWQVHRLQVDTVSNRANIELVFVSGLRYRYGDINVTPTIIRADLVEKLLGPQQGLLYDASELIQTQQHLQNANYFSKVGVSPGQVDKQQKTIAVDIRLVEKNRNSYRAGFGFGTDTGPRLAGAWDSHYLNDRGHKLENDLRLSLVRSSLSSSYLIPFLLGTERELGINTSVSREDTDTSTSNKFQAGVQHLQDRWGWNETLSLTYELEDYRIADISTTSNLLIPGISYWKTQSDDPVLTMQGWRLSADLQGAVDGIVSSVSFLQMRLRGKLILPVFEKGRLITRADLGATVTSGFSKMPASFRFFAGGDNSIRGFDIDALGPVNDNGEVVGGKYLLVGSLEYEHFLRKKWSVAIFGDFGNAYNDFSTEFAYGIGAGVRWHSPVGAIRVDLASGISDPDNPIRLHIIVGPDL